VFLAAEAVTRLWDALLGKGAHPVGLGARDTLRLEAALPLYGHELGRDPEGRDIPVFAISLARIAVSFSPLKGDFIGKQALQRQYRDLTAIMNQRFDDLRHLPRTIRPLELLDKGVARAGAPVFYQGKPAGHVTSGTMVPYWVFQGEGIHAVMGEQSQRRAIALALLDSHIPENTTVGIEVRGKTLDAVVMPYLLRSEAPPYVRAITRNDIPKSQASTITATPAGDPLDLTAVELIPADGIMLLAAHISRGLAFGSAPYLTMATPSAWSFSTSSKVQSRLPSWSYSE
jgi:aminomethyltransferase